MTNFGNTVIDKYGFYVYAGCNIKEVDENTKIWIAKHNPTRAGYPEEEIGKKDFDVYIVPAERIKKQIEPIAKGFKTREAAKKWVNKNII